MTDASAARRGDPVTARLGLAVVVALGAALHAYESIWLAAGGPAYGFFLWSMAPYAMCGVVALVSRSSIPAIAGCVAALAFDLLAHDQVFIRPTSSTSALALLFAPLWNVLIISPFAMLMSWLMLRRIARRRGQTR